MQSFENILTYTNRVCITCILLNKRSYYIRVLTPLTFMADSENKTVHFQFKISCINTNVITVTRITHCIIIYVIIDFIHSRRHVRWQRFHKNKFELDRPNHDSPANHPERYLVQWQISIDGVYAILFKCKIIIWTINKIQIQLVNSVNTDIYRSLHT